MRNPLLPVTALALLAFPLDAWAYLDPGTGSYILQLALAGILASMFTLKMYWQRLKAWFAGRSKAEPATVPPVAESSGNTDESS